VENKTSTAQDTKNFSLTEKEKKEEK